MPNFKCSNIKFEYLQKSKFNQRSKMFKCAWCAKTFSHQSGLDLHMVSHTKEKPHKCHICSRAFGVESSLKNHIKVVHDGIKRTRNKNQHCAMCSYKCNSKHELEIHVRKHTAERPFSCHITGCGFQAKYKYALSTHALQVHSDKRPYECPSEGCSYKAKTRKVLVAHLKVHSKTFSCTVSGCNYSSKSKGDLKTHVSRVHSNEKPFKCSFCDFRAKKKCYVTEHQLTHMKIKRYKCQAPNCAFASHQRSNLKNHFDRKHRTNEFLCTEPRCNFRCSSVAVLKVHLKKHELPILKCPGDFCGFSTRYKSSLLEHISRRHKGFQSSDTVFGTRIPDVKTAGTMITLHCSFTDCSFQTKFRHLYDRHVITHKKDEKGQHVCSLCFSRFSCLSLLKAHVQRHIGEKPYSCAYCSYTTKERFELRKHARRIHQIHVIPSGKDDQVRQCHTCGRNCFSYGESVLHSMTHLQPVVVLKQLKIHVL